MRFTILTLVALASSVSAVGNAIIKNNGKAPFYVWSVGDSVGPKQTVAPGKLLVRHVNPSPLTIPGGKYTEALHTADKAGGIALKITTVNDGLYTGAAQQIFAYTLDGANVWYDLSDVFGEPFKGHRLTVSAPGGGTIDWPAGTNPGGSQVKVAPSTGDVTFTAFA